MTNNNKIYNNFSAVHPNQKDNIKMYKNNFKYLTKT